MRTVIKIFLLTSITILFSCEKQGLLVKCQDCTATEPVKTELIIKLDTGPFGASTLINVYEGNIEDSILYSSTYALGTSANISVTLNKQYTATATYYKSDNTYITVDSATPRVRYDKTTCNDPCYFVYDRNLDLRLKYTK